MKDPHYWELRALAAEADLQIEQQQHAIARAELDEATHALQRIGEDVLPDPVKYSDITPHSVVMGHIRSWIENHEEIARLRDIISPGDAAAYEQGMAALEAKLAALEHDYAEAQDIAVQAGLGRINAQDQLAAMEARLARVVEILEGCSAPHRMGLGDGPCWCQALAAAKEER